VWKFILFSRVGLIYIADIYWIYVGYFQTVTNGLTSLRLSAVASYIAYLSITALTLTLTLTLSVQGNFSSYMHSSLMKQRTGAQFSKIPTYKKLVKKSDLRKTYDEHVIAKKSYKYLMKNSGRMLSITDLPFS